MAVLVISCDKYADLWRPFFALFWRHWPDCPFSVFLGTNNGTYTDERVTSIRVGEDVGWTDGVRRMLDALSFRFVMVFLDDFLIEEPVQGAAVERALDCVQEFELGCLRLGDANLFRERDARTVGASPELRRVAPWARITGVAEYGEVISGTPYRVSTQVSIWRVDVLRRFLIPGATAWEFEEIGSQLSESMRLKFWAVWKPVVEYDHAIEKGKWKQEGIAICASFGVVPDIHRRESFSKSELAEHFRRQRSGAELAAVRHAVFNQLRSGRWLEGLCCAGGLIWKFPANITNWLIMCFALFGSTALQYARNFRLLMRIRRIRKRRQPGKVSRTG